ncbi:MAG: hypothetical protein ACT4OK_08810 [Gemmobacter sp.]
MRQDLKDQPDAGPLKPADHESSAAVRAADGSVSGGLSHGAAVNPVAAARAAGKALLEAGRPAPPVPPAPARTTPAPHAAPAETTTVRPGLAARQAAAAPPTKVMAVPRAAGPAPRITLAAAETVSTVTPLPSPRNRQPDPPPAATPLPGAGTGAGLASFSGASAARMKKRHWGLLATFVMFVVLPAAAVAWYLWAIALDQYASRLGFSVQKEEMGSALEMLGGIVNVGGSSSSSDTDILYKFIRSRELVRNLQTQLDLVAIYTRPQDPVFSMPSDPSIEDIEDHWNRKVDIFYDNASQLIEVRALAFDPQDALHITQGIAAESTRILNDLSAIARADATNYAREELDKSLVRLKDARQALTAFRIRSQIVDPAADIQGRMGLMNTLLAQQATALIDLDLLAANTSSTDPRYTQAEKRVEVIEARIREERARFGDKPAEEDQRYADLVGEFEALSVDLEFAQQAYLSSLVAFDSAVAEAQRKSRYLATYQSPTLAEEAQFPQRRLIFSLALGFFFAVWAIMVLVYYTMRDRK